MTSLSYLPIVTMAVSAISDDVFCHLRIFEESRHPSLISLGWCIFEELEFDSVSRVTFSRKGTKILQYLNSGYSGREVRKEPKV